MKNHCLSKNNKREFIVQYQSELWSDDQIPVCSICFMELSNKEFISLHEINKDLLQEEIALQS